MKPISIFDPNIKEHLLTHLGVPNNRIIDFEYKDTGRTVRKFVSAVWLMVFQYRTAMTGLGYSKWKIDDLVIDEYITDEWGEVVFLPLDQRVKQVQLQVSRHKLPSDFMEPVSAVVRELSVSLQDTVSDCTDGYQVKMHVSTAYMTSEFEYAGCANNKLSQNNFFAAVKTLTNHLVKTTEDTAMQEFVENHWWQVE